MPPAIDWSWGDAYQTPAFASEPSCHVDNALLSNGDSLMEIKSKAPVSIIGQGLYLDKALRTHLAESKAPIQLPSPMIQHHRKESQAGRKRSIAEISDDDDSTGPSSSSGGSSSSPTKLSNEPIYGPGMTIDYPTNQAGASQPGSQSGYWAEELSERLRSSSFPETRDRPHQLESRKSIRLDPDQSFADVANARPSISRSLPESRNQIATFATPVQVRSASSSVTAHDEANIALGVGWSSFPSDPQMCAAARGWSRFIEMNYPLQSAKMVWRNQGMRAILASAATRTGSPGYFLFDEELAQGQLVAKSWERCLDNLRERPFRFEGEVTMSAGAECGVGTSLMEYVGSSADHEAGSMELD